MQPFSVAQFIEFLNTALSSAVFPEGVWVEGEVAEYRVSQGKWIWFLLKDEESVLSCFATTWQLRQPLEEGMRVRAFGRPKVHQKSGKFSLNVERVEPVGEGALRRAFELLKKRLAGEGLFNVERKRALPRFPRRIGLIASGESAAYGDFLRILGNRWGGTTVQHIDVQVQGRDAPQQIVAAFAHFNRHPELAEALVLVRGGGSLEDLSAFNSEEVARAVFGSRAPVLVGVGHERDETLADFVADVRASTPSNAAELLVPDRRDVLAEITARQRRLAAAMDGEVRRRVADLADATETLERGIRRSRSAFDELVRGFGRRLVGYAGMIGARQTAVLTLTDRLAAAETRHRRQAVEAVLASERLLQGLDPRRLLRRGYAIVRRGPAGRPLTDAASVDIGESLSIQLAQGTLAADVTGRSGSK